MTTLLVAEYAGGELSDATAKALTAAVALGADVHVLVAGKGVQALRMRRPSFPASPRFCLLKAMRWSTSWPSRPPI